MSIGSRQSTVSGRSHNNSVYDRQSTPVTIAQNNKNNEPTNSKNSK